MIKLGRFSSEVKIVAVFFTVLLVLIVFSFILPGNQRFYIMVFLSFIGVPTLWHILREEESGDRGEIDMEPEKLTRLHRDDVSDYLQYSIDNPYVQRQMKRLEETKKEYTSSDEEEKKN